MDSYPKPSRGSACYGNWEKLWPDGPLGSNTDLTNLMQRVGGGGDFG